MSEHEAMNAAWPRGMIDFEAERQRALAEQARTYREALKPRPWWKFW